ncbi:MAG TPA: zinc-binding dehydrogenase [Thermohalobaculum sp.]|nr:zinc-binding dehydrogenase [Thermohalobaculum sp.]
MRGVLFTGNRTLELRDFPDPSPAEDEVVIEIRASGMCGSDLHVYRAPEPSRFIAGHEPCGVVVDRGRAVPERMAPRDARVMVHHYDGCRCCPNCLSGWTQLCDEGSVVYGRTGHGAHARYMKIPGRTLVALPDELSFIEGAAVSCGTGTAYGALKRMRMEGGGIVAVYGQGPVGLSATMIAKAMGAEVIAIDLSPDRLARARDFGADHLVDAATDEPVAAVKELTGGLGAEYVIECSGATPAIAAAVRSTKAWGACCFVGMGGDLSVNVRSDVITRQLTLMGSWTFSSIGQKDCAEFCARHKLPVEDLFTHRFGLGEAKAAYELFDTQTTGKAVILPE